MLYVTLGNNLSLVHFASMCSDSSFLKQEEEKTTPSRRKCLACLCAVTLISASGPTMLTPNGLASDMMSKPAVCRNCNGSGAVLCKNFARLVFLAMSLLQCAMVFTRLKNSWDISDLKMDNRLADFYSIMTSYRCLIRFDLSFTNIHSKSEDISSSAA